MAFLKELLLQARLAAVRAGRDALEEEDLRAALARPELSGMAAVPFAEGRSGAVLAEARVLNLTPPKAFGGPRLCLVRTHPSYVRPDTWVHDPRKTVLFVQFGIVRGGQMRRIDADNTTNGGRVKAAGGRQDRHARVPPVVR